MEPDSQRTLRKSYDEAPVGLCFIDTELRYVHVNRWLAQLNGLPAEKHVGRTIHEVIPEVAAGVEAQMRQVMETNTPIVDGTVEATTRADPDVVRTFLHSYLPVVDRGRVVGVNCLVQDITARIKAETALQKRTVELRQANGDLQHALDNIKTLKGLVPICAHCKSIRNDRGFWEELETFMDQHSEAKFSHGVCPDCLEAHYPAEPHNAGTS